MGCFKPHPFFIFATYSMYMMAFSSTSALIPQVVIDEAGSDSKGATMYGFLASTNSLCLLLLSPFWGVVSDKYGRKKVCLVALIGYTIDLAALWMRAPFWMLFITRGIGGATNGILAAGYAYVADTTTMKDRTKWFGIMLMCVGIAMAAAAPSIGYVSDNYGMGWGFFVAICLNAINFFYTLFIVPESSKGLAHFEWRMLNPFASFGMLTVTRQIKYLSLCFFLIQLAEEGVIDVTTLYLKHRFHWGAFDIGLMWAFMGAFFVLSLGPILRFMLNVFGEKKSALVAVGINTLSVIGYALIAISWEFYIFMSVRSVALIVLPIMQGYISKQFKAEQQGRVSGVLAAMKNTCSFLGPLAYDNLFSFFISKKSPVQVPGIVFYVAAAEFVFGFFALVAVFHAFPVPDIELSYDLKIDPPIEEYQSLLTNNADYDEEEKQPAEPEAGGVDEKARYSVNQQ